MEDHPVPKALLFLCPVYGDIPSRLSIEGNREYRSLALRSKSWYNGYIGPYNTRQGLSPAIQCTSQIEWCRRWDSNPHEVYPQRFLRPSRLPVPPLRPAMGLLRHSTSAHNSQSNTV